MATGELQAEASAPKIRQRKEQQRAVDTRASILSAALSEFAAKGFEGASTRDIATRADVKQQLVVYHFGSKDALWKAVALDLFAELEGIWHLHIPDDADMPAMERVRIEYKTFLRFTIEHPQFHHFMLQENLPSSPRLAWLVENVLARLFQRILPPRRGIMSARRI
ncbi:MULTISPECIES: TetR/AcrR family transcriptional regulator [unclassified Sphingobium]|uniref:TetR/AcrR family transcriptional regulator n=1 Tax=unclassified Sphingobium TaxID=2611147 RepID=UPI00214AF70F|nr:MULTISPECIES: TetR/AcrR family transcriptional regulator [unclassified Sphingobium]